MSERLTRQGVRDLNGPPQNARSRPRSVGCIHEWDHWRGCDCQATWILYRDAVSARCVEVCRKCKLVRS